MTANTIKKLAGPAFIANAAANIYTQNSLIYDLIKQIKIVNKTASAATYTLYVGATGGSASGTEIAGGGGSVPANSEINLFFTNLRLAGNVDFLTGVSNTASALVITVMGESGVI